MCVSIGEIMPNRRFEDKVSIEELLKEHTSKELVAKMYLQLVQQNGSVAKMKEDIICLQNDMKQKMDWENVKRLALILGALISILTVPNLIMNAIRILGG